jgi:hypothetical protein
VKFVLIWNYISAASAAQRSNTAAAAWAQLFITYSFTAYEVNISVFTSALSCCFTPLQLLNTCEAKLAASLHPTNKFFSNYTCT